MVGFDVLGGCGYLACSAVAECGAEVYQSLFRRSPVGVRGTIRRTFFHVVLSGTADRFHDRGLRADFSFYSLFGDEVFFSTAEEYGAGTRTGKKFGEKGLTFETQMRIMRYNNQMLKNL